MHLCLYIIAFLFTFFQVSLYGQNNDLNDQIRSDSSFSRISESANYKTIISQPVALTNKYHLDDLKSDLLLYIKQRRIQKRLRNSGWLLIGTSWFWLMGGYLAEMASTTSNQPRIAIGVGWTSLIAGTSLNVTALTFRSKKRKTARKAIATYNRYLGYAN